MRFPEPNGGPPAILGLFAHPDDEVFCLGGTMATYMARGGRGRIVSLTKGEAGQIRDAASGSRSTLGAVRTEELRAAGVALGVEDTWCGDVPDGSLANAPREPLVEFAAGVIDDFEPDVVISFGPDGAYGHPDHIAAGEIAVEAVRRSVHKPAMLQAVFPRQSKLLVSLIVEWLTSLDERFLGNESFAHGLMLFADGSSMLGYAADHLAVRFFPAGSFIIEQGEPSGELFLVLSGSVDIVHEAEDGARSLLATSGPGSFFGEDGIAKGQPRSAHVVARDSVTCFVLSPGEASPSAGRGASSPLDQFVGDDANEPSAELDGCVVVDVRATARQKLEALACHQSQYAIESDFFPDSLLEGLLGVEYFRPVD